MEESILVTLIVCSCAFTIVLIVFLVVLVYVYCYPEKSTKNLNPYHEDSTQKQVQIGPQNNACDSSSLYIVGGGASQRKAYYIGRPNDFNISTDYDVCSFENHGELGQRWDNYNNGRYAVRVGHRNLGYGSNSQIYTVNRNLYESDGYGSAGSNYVVGGHSGGEGDGGNETVV